MKQKKSTCKIKSLEIIIVGTHEKTETKEEDKTNKQTKLSMLTENSFENCMTLQWRNICGTR